MTINLKIPDIRELKPRITVFGTGGAGGNAVNNMIASGLQGVDFVVANTDAQALTMSKAERIIQMGVQVTEGLGAGSQPEVGRAAAEEVIDEIRDHLQGAHMVFVTAGMGGGTGTGAAPVVARCAKEAGILTVGVVTKPFHFEGVRRMRVAENGIAELHKVVDTLLIIPNQNLFRVANEKTTFADAFAMADQVLYSGVACITDLMVKEGLINLDFADVRAVMREMGKAMMGTGEASGEKRALSAAEAAIANPLIDDASMKGAKGLLISITGGKDLTLYEVDEAATRIREEVDQDANIIVGATFDESLEGIIRVSVVATGIDQALTQRAAAAVPDGAHRRAHPEAARRPAARRAHRPPRDAHGPADDADHPGEPPASDAGGDRDRRQGGGRGRAAADGRPRGRHHPSDPAQAVAVPGNCAAAAAGGPGAAQFHPAVAGAARQPAAADAAHRRIPAARAERAARQARRGDRAASRRRSAECGLLRRLAAVGLGRRDEEEPEKMPSNVRPVRPAPRPADRAPPPPPPAPSAARRARRRRPSGRRPPEPRGPEPVSEYARRPAHQGLDPHGRQAPVHNTVGRRSARHPGVPAPAGELTNPRVPQPTVPADTAGTSTGVDRRAARAGF